MKEFIMIDLDKYFGTNDRYYHEWIPIKNNNMYYENVKKSFDNNRKLQWKFFISDSPYDYFLIIIKNTLFIFKVKDDNIWYMLKLCNLNSKGRIPFYRITKIVNYLVEAYCDNSNGYYGEEHYIKEAAINLLIELGVK